MDKTLAFGSPLGAHHLVEARKELSWGGLHLERLEFLSLFVANHIFFECFVAFCGTTQVKSTISMCTIAAKIWKNKSFWVASFCKCFQRFFVTLFFSFLMHLFCLFCCKNNFPSCVI
jgi:hypothetical protein